MLRNRAGTEGEEIESVQNTLYICMKFLTVFFNLKKLKKTGRIFQDTGNDFLKTLTS